MNAVLADDPALALSISYTTRAPRAGEANGREYHFVDRAAFQKMLEAGEFLESAEVHGNFYATSQKQITDSRAAGRDVVLEIDWQGAAQVRRLFPEAIGIFILPPSTGRARAAAARPRQGPDETIRRRLAAAETEMSHAGEFDYVIINNDFEEARRDLAAVVRASRLTLSRQSARHPELFRLHN